MADLSGEFCSISVQRRSTRQFTGASIEAKDLGRVLDFSHRFMRSESTQLLGLDRFSMFIAHARVKGIDSGHWQYCCEKHQLFLRKAGIIVDRCRSIALGRIWRRGGCVIYTAPADAVSLFGDRIYRTFTWFLGHQINLACMRLNAGVSGIAGFFDDSLGQFLGLPEGHIVTYITLSVTRCREDSQVIGPFFAIFSGPLEIRNYEPPEACCRIPFFRKPIFCVLWIVRQRLKGCLEAVFALGGEDFLKKTAKNCGRGLATFPILTPMSHEQGRRPRQACHGFSDPCSSRNVG